MTRKIISLLLCLLLCAGLAVNVSAEGKTVDFIIDEQGNLADSEIAALNNYAAVLYDVTGVGIFFVYTNEEDIEDYDVASLVNGISDYVIMMENATHWYMHLGGRGEIIDVDTENALRDVYDADETFVGGVGAYLDAVAEYFPYIEETPATDAFATDETFLYDEADILTAAEETALVEKLRGVSQDYHAQIVVATMASMDGGDIDSFVDYLYDSMGFGYGVNHDGVLILVCMDPREYRILSNGFAGVAIDPDDIGLISDKIVDNLSGGDYAGAFHEFADECAYYLDGHINGFAFDAGGSLATSLIIGVVIGLIVAFALKGQLKSVRSQSHAREYVKDGSMHLSLSNDMFLYRNVTRTKRESSSSSGSSGSSGGTARSKGGGSF